MNALSSHTQNFTAILLTLNLFVEVIDLKTCTFSGFKWDKPCIKSALSQIIDLAQVFFAC